MSDISDKLLTEFDTLAHKYAPDVIDAALTSVRIDSINNLISGFIAFVFVCVFTYLANLFRKKHTENTWDNEIYGLGVLCALILAIISTVIFLTSILDIWNWVGIFNPKLWLAHKAIG